MAYSRELKLKTEPHTIELWDKLFDTEHKIDRVGYECRQRRMLEQRAASWTSG
jgi:hypothetical protein